MNAAEEVVAIRWLFMAGSAAQTSHQEASSGRIILVTSAFHLRCAQRLLERQALVVQPFPVDFQARGRWADAVWSTPMQWLPSARTLDCSSRGLRELLGRVVYRAW